MMVVVLIGSPTFSSSVIRSSRGDHLAPVDQGKAVDQTAIDALGVLAQELAQGFEVGVTEPHDAIITPEGLLNGQVHTALHG